MAGISVNEILQYKVTDKRKLGDEVDENSAPSNPPKLARTERKSTEVVAELEEKSLESEDLDTIDDASVKRLVMNFEKRMLKNQELRVKFPDQPEKFMEAEIELNVAIQELHAVATVPHLYYLLIELGAVQSLLQLLIHENTDITIAVVDLLQELCDVDTLNESEEGANALINALLEGQVISLLVQNMERLNEANRDEADGVHNTLGVLENIMEFKPEVSFNAVDQKLLVWLLKRIKQKGPFDGNKLYASEILAILLQNADEAKKALGEQDGIDILLQQLAVYKRHNPSSLDEIEFMENLFNCLCASLLFAGNRQLFLRGEGLQLMNLMLREKKLSRSSALKVLSYAMNGPEGKENCDKFVEILGLRTIFPLFMKTPSRHKRKGYTSEEHEEHSVSIVASLLRNCGQTPRQRIFSKFLESDCAKVERLMELHFKYATRVMKFEQKFDEENKDEETDEEDKYLQKLDAGLFTLQLVDYIIVDICANGDAGLKDRVVKILQMRGGSTNSIKAVMKEFVENFGSGAAQPISTDKPDMESPSLTDEQQRISQMIDSF